MATIQRGTTKIANRLLSYAEKRAEERSGVDCPAEYARAQFKATRELWGKTDGIQAHHVIQSFKPGEVTPEMANQIGRDLAREIAKGHEAVVYTHTDKGHIHNHIVINAVSYEDGRKYHAHGTEELYKIREVSDRLCKERGLSVVKEYSAATRYTLSEKALIEKGKDSWKDEIRQAIDFERKRSKTYEEFKSNLTKEFSIEVKERGKHITFTHPNNGMKVRGYKLGNSYEKEMLKNEFERKVERSTEHEGRTRIDPADVRGNGNRENRDIPRTNGTSGSNRSETDISRLEEFSKYALGQKRLSQEPIRANDDRNSERNESNARAFPRTLETNTAEKQRDQRTISSSIGEQQRGKSKGSESHSRSLSEERRRNEQSIGNNHEVGADQRARKENRDKGKASIVRNHSRVERSGLNRSEPPMDGSTQLNSKDKSKDEGMDFGR